MKTAELTGPTMPCMEDYTANELTVELLERLEKTNGAEFIDNVTIERVLAALSAELVN